MNWHVVAILITIVVGLAILFLARSRSATRPEKQDLPRPGPSRPADIEPDDRPSRVTGRLPLRPTPIEEPARAGTSEDRPAHGSVTVEPSAPSSDPPTPGAVIGKTRLMREPT